MKRDMPLLVQQYMPSPPAFLAPYKQAYAEPKTLDDAALRQALKDEGFGGWLRELDRQGTAKAEQAAAAEQPKVV